MVKVPPTNPIGERKIFDWIVGVQPWNPIPDLRGANFSNQNNMKRIVFKSNGPASVLTLERSDSLPTPVETQVRIAVKACGINFADILCRKGLYPDCPALPACVGYEVSGIIDAVGPSAPSHLKIGSHVVALLPNFGGYASSIVADSSLVVVKPNHLTFIEAVVIPLVYLTAWQLIYAQGSFREGHSVLVHSAGGAVGLAALDIALHLKASQIIGTASGKKHEFLKERGYTNLIDYKTENVFKRTLELTGGKGVDLILDPIGSDWKENYSCLRTGGRMGCFGIQSLASSDNMWCKMTSGAQMMIGMPKYTPLQLISENKGVFGVSLGFIMKNDPERLKEQLEVLVNAAWVRVRVDKVFLLDHAADAHEYIQKGGNLGKCVMVVDEADLKHWEAKM